MKYLALTILVCLLVCALAAAMPADESLPGEIYGDSEQYNPHDPQAIFKLKKLKKLLLG